MEERQKEEAWCIIRLMKNLRPLSTLRNYDKNPRSIKKADFERLKKHILDHGQMQPLVITPDGEVLGGNMRLRAYREMGIKDVWVEEVEPKNEADKLRIALVLNDRAGYYDADLLANLIPEYPDFNWEDYTVDMKEPQNLKDLIDKYTEVEEDEAPPLADGEPISKYGEVYQLGRHRLMCGDATKIEDVEKLMDGQKADMVLTDPPYNTGMSKKPDSTRLSHMFNDSFTPEQFAVLLTDSLSNMYTATKGSAVFYVCIDWRNVGMIKEELEKLMPVKNVIVWDKIVHGLGSDYKFTYEMIVVGKKGEPVIENRIGTDYQDIWRVQRTMGRNEDHATAKPLELLKKPLLHASKEDDIVLDLFGGSGSTLIACEQTDRICYISEIDPRYCDVIRKRYENFVANQAQKIESK